MDGANMKDGADVTAVERGPDSNEFSNRRLIRPSLPRFDHGRADGNERRERNERGERSERPSGPPRKTAPPEQTNAENFYYQKQMQSRTPMVIVLQDGEEVHGVIEWYDRCCIKVNRNGQANLMIYKPSIKYMYKESENGRSENGRR
jgi:sRNA-binding regulator protein Hfq